MNDVGSALSTARVSQSLSFDVRIRRMALWYTRTAHLFNFISIFRLFLLLFFIIIIYHYGIWMTLWTNKNIYTERSKDCAKKKIETKEQHRMPKICEHVENQIFLFCFLLAAPHSWLSASDCVVCTRQSLCDTHFCFNGTRSTHT